MSRSLRDGLKPVRDLPLLFEQTDSLNRLARPVREALTSVIPAGSTLNEALSGTALGHPLHFGLVFVDFDADEFAITQILRDQPMSAAKFEDAAWSE